MSSSAAVRDRIAFMFGMEGKVAARDYLLHGMALMALKYAGDNAITLLASGRGMTPWAYLLPVAQLRLEGVTLPSWAVFATVAWAMPFLWIGLSMTMRRAFDAGHSPGLALWFLLPIANLGLIAWLCFAPSRELDESLLSESDRAETRVKIASVVWGAGLSLVLTALCAQLVGGYGGALFLGTPTLVGFVTGWLSNRPTRRSLRATLGLATTVIALSACGMLLFALEGVVCLAIIVPLALPFAWLGATLGRAWAVRLSPKQVAVLAVMLPLIMGAEHGARPTALPRAVRTEIVVDAPPEVVWEHVIGFSELPPPTEAIFAFGIAYPLRAEIRGTGVGAVRHCVFSTGPFVEPITVWDPPHRLGFDVTQQPAGMRETSPYNQVYAPHLDGYPQSERGEFLLLPTPSGGTRLVGTTWYRIDLFPQAYFAPMSDAFIHTIHRRVLQHVKRLSEAR